MTTIAASLALLGPLALVAAGFALDRRHWGGLRLAEAAAGAALAVAALCLVSVAAGGSVHTATLGVAGVGFGFYLDGLSATMFTLVAFVGLVVVRYSRAYMAGAPGNGQARFTRWLCWTLAAVLLLIVSGNLFQLLLAWVATSVGLNKLLLFYPERQAAVLAARKKFLASRAGDVCLLGAMLLLHGAFGTLEYGALFAGAEAMRAVGATGTIHAAALLLVLAAALKSAQFPLHGWLLEVMETPTPVSALLHAGIINAGGFLVLRFSDVIVLSAPSLHVLVVVGAATALFGSAVMLTQTSVKSALACSTVAQMGFMLLQCGLGAFPAALLHIVAHSLYKAHAFLSSGSIVDIARTSWSPSPGGRPHPWRLLLAVGVVLGTALAVGAAFGATIASKPGVVVLGAVLLLGLTHLVAQGFDERPNAYVLGRTLGQAAAVAVAYFALQLLAERLFAGSLAPAPALRGVFDVGVAVLVVLAFAAMTVLQSVLATQPNARRWQALHTHVSNGFYVNTVANRLVLRFWPTGTNRTGASLEGARP